MSRLLSAPPVINSNRNTNVEAATEPILHFCNIAHIGRSEPQMKRYNSFHPFASVMKMGEEAALLVEISQLMKDIYLPLLGEGISDVFPQEPARSHHDNGQGHSSSGSCWVTVRS